MIGKQMSIVPIARGLVAALAVVLVAACSVQHQSQALLLLDNCRAPVHYVALGDSTVEGVGASHPDFNYVSRLHARLRALYPNARVTNLGVGGATSADVIARQLDRAIKLRPDVITLSIGPNDITRGVPLARYEQNLDGILGRLRRETAALIVVNLLPDLAVTPRFANGPQADVVGRLTVQFNEALVRKGGAHDVTLVDLYSRAGRKCPDSPCSCGETGITPPMPVMPAGPSLCGRVSSRT